MERLRLFNVSILGAACLFAALPLLLKSLVYCDQCIYSNINNQQQQNNNGQQYNAGVLMH